MSDAGSGTTISFRQEFLRKGVHLSSFWMVCLIWFWPWNDRLLFYFFLVCLILNLLCEFTYSMEVPVISKVYAFFFGKMLRKKPERGEWIVSGSPPVFLAAALVSLLFPRFIGATAFGVMLIADTAAALVGRRFGRHKLNGCKSREGTAAFLVSGTVFAWLLLLFSGNLCLSLMLAAVGGVSLAAMAELFQKQIRLDDNLTIPLSCGFVMTVVYDLLIYLK